MFLLLSVLGIGLLFIAFFAAPWYLRESQPVPYAPERHIAVTIALFPLACLAAISLQVSTSSILSGAADLTARNILPPPVAAVARLLGAPPADATLTDVLLVVCLLQVGYGSVIVCRHLVDIVRLLKLSRRRLMRPENEKLKRMEGAIPATATGTGTATAATAL